MSDYQCIVGRGRWSPRQVRAIQAADLGTQSAAACEAQGNRWVAITPHLGEPHDSAAAKEVGAVLARLQDAERHARVVRRLRRWEGDSVGQ